MRGTFPVLVVKDQGPLGGNLIVCWAAEMEGSQVASLGMAKEMDSILHCQFTTLNPSWEYSKWRSPSSAVPTTVARGRGPLERVQNTLSPVLRSMEKVGLRNEEGNMMSCSRHPQSVSPYPSTEKKSRCGGNGQKMCAKK